jgi:hypothetical protein
VVGGGRRKTVHRIKEIIQIRAVHERACTALISSSSAIGARKVCMYLVELGAVKKSIKGGKGRKKGLLKFNRAKNTSR